MDQVLSELPLPLSSLSSDQILKIKESLNIEIRALSNHLLELRQAVNRLESSKKCLDEMNSSTTSKSLVPLTQSVYAYAKLNDTQKVLIDIGTGYHLEMTISKAKEHFDRRIKVINETCSKAAQAIGEKKEIIKKMNETIQSKS